MVPLGPLTWTFSLALPPFIRPNQYVNYSENSAVVRQAAAECQGITENLTTPPRPA